MKRDLTELAVVLDRSGSMDVTKDKMDQSLWSFIENQKNVGKECRVSLYQFDEQFEVCFEGATIDAVKQADCALVPKGRTALNDAVVKFIAAIEARIMMEKEEDRPEFVVVVVVTDGQENASKENTVADAGASISRCRVQHGWKFAFLASDPVGFAATELHEENVVRTSMTGPWGRRVKEV